ncbi:MAG: DnaJ domain-containing protein [Solirubrobacteraceae bacterium]
MDPFSVLGIDSGVSEADLTAAYRALAKRWHPDSGAGDPTRMGEINEAYRLARDELRRAARRHGRGEPVVRRRTPPGSWLPDSLRKALGWELLSALGENEQVRLVAQAGRSGAGPAKLALTDRRLLWVAEDAVTARVDWVRFGIVAGVEQRRTRLGRRTMLRLRTSTGRRVSFGDLRPEAAEAIVAGLQRSGVAA